jgi:hypothetical protein
MKYGKYRTRKAKREKVGQRRTEWEDVAKERVRERGES